MISSYCCGMSGRNGVVFCIIADTELCFKLVLEHSVAYGTTLFGSDGLAFTCGTVSPTSGYSGCYRPTFVVDAACASGHWIQLGQAHVKCIWESRRRRAEVLMDDGELLRHTEP